jgi:hypothetical protein
MTIICYAPSGNLDGKRLFEEIVTVVPAHDAYLCHSCEELRSLDSRLGYTDTILVLLIADREALEEMLSMKDALWRRDLILILPDSEAATVSKGHSLRPRFVTYLDGVLGHVPMVLAKMADHRQRRRNDRAGSILENSGFASPAPESLHDINHPTKIFTTSTGGHS